ncbi:unnamed protein product [marine sediment metagenome]|uniref:GTP cyclohydrolase II domain-containing protein n=1 Tax=marine sediment metagenome TaxID=412755 RepID=X1S493_9ZZZZ
MHTRVDLRSRSEENLIHHRLNILNVIGLKGYGLEIIERINIEVPITHENASYMQTKKDKMGHILTMENFKTKEKEIGKKN